MIKNRIGFMKSYIVCHKKNFSIVFAIMTAIAFLNVIPSLFLKRVFDYGFPNKDMNNIIFPALAMIVVYGITSYLNYKSLLFINNLSQGIVAQIRDDVTEKMIKFPMEFFDLNKTGYVAARVSEVNNLLGLFSQTSIKTLISAMEFVGVTVILFFINAELTLFLLILSPIYILVSRNYSTVLSRTSSIVLEHNSRLNSRVQQSFNNIEEIKNLSSEKEEQDVLKEANSNLLKYSIEQTNTIVKSTELLTFISLFSTSILIISGGFYIVNAKLSLGDYMVFATLLGKLYAPMQSISLLSLTLKPGFAALDRIIEFMSEKDETENEKNKKHLDVIEIIRFKNVSFSYRYSKKPIISNLDFDIKSKDKIRIMGPNGAGKTTIFRLLLSLYEPQNGEILFNEQNQNKYKKADIRNKISIISQNIRLFPGTIEENIRYGSNISDKEYKIKISDHRIQAILKNLPREFVVTNGDNLSGGQIQRIAIARGLIRNVDLFLFDEATSNLDIDGISSLIDLIESTLSDKTCIFIEHEDIFDSICNKKIELTGKGTVLLSVIL